MIEPLDASQLRWVCAPESLQFETTNDLPETRGVVGQPAAVEALRFGLECEAPGQNVFVRGLTGTGRMTLVAQMLEELKPACAAAHAYCYVHNFSETDRPRLITLDAGQGKAFRRRVSELAEFIRDGLGEALDAAGLKSKREVLESQAQRDILALTQPFSEELRAADLELVSLKLGPVAQPAILPVVDGEPVPPEQFEQLHDQGEVSDEQYDAVKEGRQRFQQRRTEVTTRVQEIQRQSVRDIRSVTEDAARQILGKLAVAILEDFPGDDVKRFLAELIDDLAENRLTEAGQKGFDPLRLYSVNVVLDPEPGEGGPVVLENTPTVTKLLGTVERGWGPQGPTDSDHTKIRPGSLLRADGGYLVLEARDVVGEAGAWKILVRTLRTGSLEMVPSELGWPFMAQPVKPEPIPLRLRVLLVGDRRTFHLLDRYDADFPHLFKVLADFDTVIDRMPDNVSRYAEIVARIAREEGLPPFHRSAVAMLVEHGARIAARSNKLTARFGRIADIAREAAYLARRDDQDVVRGSHVRLAVQRTKGRADLPARRFREAMSRGSINVRTQGEVVGQVNGLAVLRAGPLTYGVPSRITASIGAGSAGIINIEVQSSLSGAIHTKGFHILGGLLRHLLQTDHPLAFSASLAFEQTYGSIDGDSASCAETCCLLSELTGLPIRQGIAITGAIDQHGQVQAIGGVNEKIEGFFDACGDGGLTGNQGVVIPRANAGDLMLRPDVVDACVAGEFRVWAVECVHEALEVLTGFPAGQRDDHGEYPEGTLLHLAVLKAHEYWLKTVQRPRSDQQEDEVEDPGAEGGDKATVDDDEMP